MPMTLVVSIYNSAGEQVKLLFSGPSQDSSQGFAMDTGSFMAMNGAVNLSFDGALSGLGKTLTWMGDNNSGQPVSGGTYYVKAEMTDAFGSTQAWSQAVNVMPQAAEQSLKIYNSAGELVAVLDASGLSGQALTRLGFSKGDNAAYALGSGGGVDFLLQDSGGKQAIVYWDGKSSSGVAAKPGSYTVQLIDNNNGRMILVSKGFVLLAGLAAQDLSVSSAPNPLPRAARAAHFCLKGIGSADFARARLYNLAGELVSEGGSSPGSANLTLAFAPLAPGIYIAAFEIQVSGQAPLKKTLKIACQP